MQDNQKNLSKRITIRLTENEWKLLQEYIYLSQTSMSKYVRKKLYGGRPIVPKTDMLMINELRRIGGLLKHNFTTMREANMPKELSEMQEKALQELVKAMGKIGTKFEEQK